MKAIRLRAVLAWVGSVALVLGVLAGTRPAAADDSALAGALEDYASGKADDGLQKLRSYVESNPAPEDILTALRSADDAVIGKVLTMGGEHERLMKYLLVRARPAVESREADPAEVQAKVDQAVKGESLELRRSAAMSLRQYGEMAVPALYPYLAAQDPETVVNAMIAFNYLGEDATMALTQVLHSDNARLRGFAAEELGEIRDRRAVGMLAMLRDSDSDEGVKQKATAALAKIGASGVRSAADGLLATGERYYHHDRTIVSAFDATRNLWRWEDGQLVRYHVPAYLYPFQVAEELAGQALDIAPDNAAARSRLVRAILSQKVEGEVLKAAGAGEPPESLGHAFDVAASQGYKAACDALGAALQSRDWDVAVEACALVARTFGGENLAGSPLGEALVAPEKRVRYAAAIAALHMSPPRGLQNADKVAALAAQAASESAVRQVLVVDDRDDTRSRLVMDLAHSGFVVGGESSGLAAVSRAKISPTLDVIIVRADLGDPSRRTPMEAHASALTVIDELLGDARTKDMRILVLVQDSSEATAEATKAFFQNKYGDKLKGFISAPLDTSAVVETVTAAAAAGNLSPDQERANRLAARAAAAFSTTDFSCTAFDLSVAVEPLSTAATEGPTPEVRLNAVKGLGNIRQGGAAALVKVLQTGDSDDLKAAAATALGNVLGSVKAEAGQVDALLQASLGEGPVAQAALSALGNVRGLTPEQRQKIYRDHKLPIAAKAGSSS
jgi:CheY-like chemotaxis protein